VLGESLDGSWPTFTIHSALGLKKNTDQEIVKFLGSGKRPDWWGGDEVRLLVVDEASMIGDELWKLTNRICLETPIKVLFVGDFCQSPPVRVGYRISKPSRVFTEVRRKTSLEMVMRHEGGILEFANRIRKNILAGIECWNYEPIPGIVDIERSRWNFEKRFLAAIKEVGREARAVAWKNVDVDALNKLARETILGKVVAEADEFIEGEIVTVSDNPISKRIGKDIQVYMHVEDEAVVRQYELVTEKRLDIEKAPNGEIQYYRLVLENITNPTGVKFVARVLTEKSKEVVKKWLDERKPRDRTGAAWNAWHKKNEEYDNIKHNAAMTVHKSQGSSFKIMGVDVTQFMRNRDPITAQKMFYVAVTRATDKVFLYFGERR
jgi:hypothetical protein